MGELLELRQSRSELSLRRFAWCAEVPYRKLRDFEKSGAACNRRKQEHIQLCEHVRQVALLHSTYGYKFLYRELRDQGESIGLHRVRQLLVELGLNSPQPRKTRKPSADVVAPLNWLVGRRVQIDATRLYIERVIGRLKVFRILAERHRGPRKRFGLRFNLITGIHNVELALSS